MCLILFSYRQHLRYRLIFAANRDEFYERPSRPAQFWNRWPDILAGKDLEAGGTWMGVTRKGRFAAITNFRDPANIIEQAPTRGFLVLDFLRGDDSPAHYLERIRARGGQYNGFNLLVGTRDTLFYYSNRQNEIVDVAPGLHGISNHLLDTGWPKVIHGKQALAETIARDPFPDSTPLFTLLQDRSRPPDHLLPQTGVSLEWERLLSPLFITSPTYGTRSSTVLLWARDGTVEFIERSFSPAHGNPVENDTREFRFVVPPA